MYKTGNFFAEFRLFHKAEKNTKIQKSVLSCFVKQQNNVSFRFYFFFIFLFCTLSSKFVIFTQVLYLLIEFRAFYSSIQVVLVPFFELNTF